MEKTNYFDLVENTFEFDDEGKVKYFEEFFVYDNYDKYEVDEDINETERAAIEVLFKGTEDIADRAFEALDIDICCKEAYLLFRCLFDEVVVSQAFKELSLKTPEYKNMTAYSKRNFIIILDMYSDFLMSIQNLTGAARQLETALSLDETKDYTLYVKLATIYTLKEDREALVELVESIDNQDCFIYLVTIVTLLKYGDMRAESIFHDMLREFPESEYIDHMWDLAYDKPEDEIFADSVDGAFNFICSVPDFYSWCNEHKTLHKLS